MKGEKLPFIVKKEIAGILRTFVLCVLVSPGISCLGYSSDLQISGSFNIQCDSYSKICLSKINYPEPSHNFYKTDSIFSFRSPKGYFPSLLYNFRHQATSPLRFKSKEWIITGAAIGITAALITFDNNIDEWAKVQKQKHNWVNKSSPVISRFGSNYGSYTVIATGLISAAFKKEKGVQTSLLATQAMFTSAVWIRLIKILSGRERPLADYTGSKSGWGNWYGPFAMYDQDLAHKRPASSFDSFPSGHAGAAFAIATVFASQYKDKKAVPFLCYSAATLVGISRLTEHKHWASDVFLGGLIGYFCGKQVVGHYNKTHPDQVPSLSGKAKNKTELVFIQEGTRIGFSLKW